jgi:hypothetical protein
VQAVLRDERCGGKFFAQCSLFADPFWLFFIVRRCQQQPGRRRRWCLASSVDAAARGGTSAVTGGGDALPNGVCSEPQFSLFDRDSADGRLQALHSFDAFSTV